MGAWIVSGHHLEVDSVSPRRAALPFCWSNIASLAAFAMSERGTGIARAMHVPTGLDIAQGQRHGRKCTADLASPSPTVTLVRRCCAPGSSICCVRVGPNLAEIRLANSRVHHFDAGGARRVRERLAKTLFSGGAGVRCGLAARQTR